MPEWHPDRWYWWGEISVTSSSRLFLRKFEVFVTHYKNNFEYAPSIFMIGRYLAIHEKTNFDNLEVSSSKQTMETIKFYKDQCKKTRTAVDMWSLVALRIGTHLINRDISKKITGLIWQNRELALY